jgi:biotin carboxyl carrier protein
VQYVVRIGGRKVSAEISESGEVVTVRIDGRSHTADLRPIGEGSYSLLIDDRSYVVAVEAEGERYVVSIGDRRLELRLMDAYRVARERRPGEPGVPQEIHAPMSGGVVDVLVSAGDLVTAGQPLLILEAMKMENEIEAPGDGEVSVVAVRPGQSVKDGQLLVTIVP